ncbi:MAG: hypothetical protein ABIO86_07550, partial [Sphingomonas sp.]
QLEFNDAQQRWLLCRGTASVLAVMLAVTWLLFDNSQHGSKALESLAKIPLRFQHNSQQKNTGRKQPGTASFSGALSLATRTS